jgi:hypothetical protein
MKVGRVFLFHTLLRPDETIAIPVTGTSSMF